MKRLIENDLNQWRLSERRKPLLLRGARRSGKTHTVLEFARTQFEGNVIHVNFSKADRVQQIFRGSPSAQSLLSTLEQDYGKKFVPGKTLLFFDEISALPRAIHNIRRLADEFAGAHVLIADSHIRSVLESQNVPLHAFQSLALQPMGFGEYLMAIGREDAARTVLDRPAIISERMHQYLFAELRSYFLIGGFPECVKAYAETKKFESCFEVQKKIIETMLAETATEEKSDEFRKCLSQVFQAVSHYIGEPVKYSDFSAEHSLPTLKRAFEDLCERGALKRVPSATPLAGPLVQSASTRQFKAVIGDIGLLQHLLGLHLNLARVGNDVLTVEHGILAEQFVGQEMALAQGGDIYFWMSRVKESTAKVHYLISINTIPYPIGVLTENHRGLWDGLDCCLTTYPVCPGGMVFGREAYRALVDKQCHQFPIYYAYSAAKGF